MARLLDDLPTGFSKTVELLNQLPENLLCEMCQEVVFSMRQNKTYTDLSKTEQGFKNLQIDISPTDIHRAVTAITHLYRKAIRIQISSSDFKEELDQILHLTNIAVSVLSRIWEEQRNSLMSVDEVSKMFGVGQLVDMQWKLGVGVSSDSCKNLNSPYVTMQFKIADPSGKLSTHSVEMTVMQFQDFSKQMKEMANVLETV